MGTKKGETYLMFRIAKGSAKPDKAHESFGIAQPDGRRNHLSISYKDSNTHADTHTHRYIYITKQETCASVFIMLHSKVCLLFPLCALFQVQLPRNEVGSNRHGSSPHWLTKVCAAWSKDSPMLNNSNHSGNIPNTLSLPVSLAAKPKYP